MIKMLYYFSKTPNSTFSKNLIGCGTEPRLLYARFQIHIYAKQNGTIYKVAM